MFWLTAASMTQRASALVLGVLLRGFLGPAKTGVWNLVEVWRQQLAALTLGVSYAADRDMPMLRGQGRDDEVELIRSVTFTYLVGEAAALAIGFWCYWAIARDGWGSDESLGLALVPILATLTTAYSAYETFLKNQKEFRLWGLFSLTQVVIDWSILAWVLAGGLTGLLIGLMVGWVARLASVWMVVRRFGLFKLRIVLDGKTLRSMVGFGLPLSVWSVAYSLSVRLDSLVIGTALGTTALGLYYLGPQLALSLGAIPAALSVVSYPNLMERYGSDGPSALAPHLERYTRVVALLLSPLTAALGVFGIGLLVEEFLPDFRDGLPAMRIAVLTILFTHSGYVAAQILLASKRARLLIAVTVAGLAVQGIVLGVTSIDGLTLEAAAWSAVAGQAAIALFVLAAALWLLRAPRVDVIRFWGRLPLAWGAFIALILAIQEASPSTDGALAGAGLALGQLAAFAIAGAAVVALVDRAAFAAARDLLRGTG